MLLPKCVTVITGLTGVRVRRGKQQDVLNAPVLSKVPLTLLAPCIIPLGPSEVVLNLPWQVTELQSVPGLLLYLTPSVL